MTQIYNSYFDIAMRVLLILNHYKKQMRVDTIMAIDLLNTYGKNYGLSDVNLHGDNSLSSSESSARKETAHKSLMYLLQRNLIELLVGKDGFTYKITDQGKDVCDNLNSEYSEEYLLQAKIVSKKLANCTDADIIKKILNYE